MNKFKKYCPNVWVAECEEEYERGEIIQIETKYGKEVESTFFLLTFHIFHYNSLISIFLVRFGGF